MPTLSSNIVRREVASPKDVERALARQAIHGGDLVTNLLELVGLNEERLLKTIAESLGLEAAPAGELPASSVVRLVPAELARRHGFFPLAEREGALVIAISEPLGAEAASELSFSVGLRVEQRAASLVRIKQAIARDYGVPLDRRSARVLARLDGKPDPSPSIAPGPISRREPTVPPDAALAEPPRGSRAGGRELDLRALGAASSSTSAQRRRMGPYTVAMAERDLLDATGRDQVVTAFFDFAAQYFEYAALFVLHGDLAEGRDANGSGAARSKVRSIGVPLDLPSTLSQVIAGREPFRLCRLSPSGIDGALLKDLERRPGPLALLVPVRVRDRAVLVLYGDHGDQDVRLDAVGDVISFTPLVVAALERLILKRKGITRPSVPPRSLRPSAEPARISVPPARVLSVEPANEEDDFERSASPRPVLAVGPGARVRTPAPGSLAPPRVTPRPFAAPHDSVQPGTSAALGEHGPDADDDEATAVIAAASGSTPPWTHAAAEVARAPRAAASLTGSEPDPGSVPSFDEPELGTKPGVGSGGHARARLDGLGTAPTAIATELPPPSQLDWELDAASLDAPHPAAPPEPELSDDTRELVRALVAGDPRAADRLVALGTSAVPALVAALPGPITSELRRGSGEGPPRASDCGPLLKTLVRIGPKAASMVAVRASDADAQVRAWATRLLGELPNPDAAEAVAMRFLDQDIEVRRAALAAGRMLAHHRGASEALASALSNVLLDPSTPDAARHMVIEAIADLREARAVPSLIRTLQHASKEIQRSAHWALVVLTRTDYGDDTDFWEAWWQENASRHRIEWLIDALVHDQQEIRRAAGDELKSTTKEYFGYYDDLSPRERERAQGRYRDWWNSKGKLRFP